MFSPLANARRMRWRGEIDREIEDLDRRTFSTPGPYSSLKVHMILVCPRPHNLISHLLHIPLPIQPNETTYLLSSSARAINEHMRKVPAAR